MKSTSLTRALACAILPVLTCVPAAAAPHPVAASVQEAQYLKINGAEQWVTIRGQDRANPVLLIIGGTQVDGPGATLTPYVRTFAPWEASFTLVGWDPRGTGRTFLRGGKVVGEDVSLEQQVADGIALVEQLRRRLGHRKIILMGVNFGSTVGVKMAQARPDLFAAYVGAGQIVANRPAREQYLYDRTLRLALAAGDDASVADLRLSGPNPARNAPGDAVRQQAFVRARARYRPPAPPAPIAEALAAGWTGEELAALRASIPLNEERMGRAWGETFDFSTLSRPLKIPVFVIQGEENDVAPTPQAKAWLDGLSAPRKGFAVIPVAGNHALETHTAEVLRVLERDVRPLAAPRRG